MAYPWASLSKYKAAVGQHTQHQRCPGLLAASCYLPAGSLSRAASAAQLQLRLIAVQSHKQTARWHMCFAQSLIATPISSAFLVKHVLDGHFSLQLRLLAT
jgi:hypothetical protein